MNPDRLPDRKYGRVNGLFKTVTIVLMVLLAGQSVHAGTRVIVAYGDSLVHGYGLFPEDGFVPQLESYLVTMGHDVRLVNAGVSGDTSAGGAARMDWVLDDDVDAVILLFGGNDLLRGIFPEEARANFDHMLSRMQERKLPVLLVGHEVPENFGPEYKRSFENIYTDMAIKYDTLFYPEYFSALNTGGNRHSSRVRYLQDDLLHPNAEGVQKIVEDIAPHVVALLARIPQD